MKTMNHLLFTVTILASLWACHSGDAERSPKSAGVESSRLRQGIYAKSLKTELSPKEIADIASLR